MERIPSEGAYGEPWSLTAMSKTVNPMVMVESAQPDETYIHSLYADVGSGPLLERAADCVNACDGVEFVGDSQGAMKELLEVLKGIHDSAHPTHGGGFMVMLSDSDFDDMTELLAECEVE